MNELDSLYHSLLGKDYQSRKDHYVKKLLLLVNNLPKTHPHKKHLLEYIDLFCKKNDSEIDLTRFQILSSILKKASLLPDDSDKELLKAISPQEPVGGQVVAISSKVSHIIPNDSSQYES